MCNTFSRNILINLLMFFLSLKTFYFIFPITIYPVFFPFFECLIIYLKEMYTLNRTVLD